MHGGLGTHTIEIKMLINVKIKIHYIYPPIYIITSPMTHPIFTFYIFYIFCELQNDEYLKNVKFMTKCVNDVWIMTKMMFLIFCGQNALTFRKKIVNLHH